MYSNFTVDCVIFGFHEGKIKVLLTERNEYPFKDTWGLPGYFVDNDEEMEHAVKRILYEHTGLKDIYLEQLSAFAGLKRHPSGRILTVAYYALLQLDHMKVKLKPITNYMKQARWFAEDEIPELAFDHGQIIELSLAKIRRKITYSPIAFELLPDKFTLTQLQMVYEAVLGKVLDKRNFRKKMLNYGFLKELPEVQKGVSYRAARLYKLDKRKYLKIFQQTISF
ncbi:NUDIX hydrolase [Sphingobacteriaceae bacterium WQ 2009]|uniref:NUDIX hydrolase n=1 Tax=Rhinopithecimicrobium faecis TaxID=2820698 RepID=A0A8T4HHV7_9SPHI|nr:NUDIX hydrolase [Sphingobacteriaceae bacterium WQ 2009]